MPALTKVSLQQCFLASFARGCLWQTSFSTNPPFPPQRFFFLIEGRSSIQQICFSRDVSWHRLSEFTTQVIYLSGTFRIPGGKKLSQCRQLIMTLLKSCLWPLGVCASLFENQRSIGASFQMISWLANIFRITSYVLHAWISVNWHLMSMTYALNTDKRDYF